MTNFADKFEHNAVLQLRKLNRAIDLYCKDIFRKNKLFGKHYCYYKY